MTTVQTMFQAGNLARLFLVASVLLGGLSACDTGRKRAELVAPEVLIAPYDSIGGDALWAVAPLGNESGVSLVETDRIADALVAKIDEARGLACLPLNRTIAAMRAKGIRAIRTPAEARAIANLLGADALVVGNITAYDPYDPPKIGLSLALFTRDRKSAEPFDPMRLRSAYRDNDYQINNSAYADKPVATISEHLDGANHEVQMDLRRYASGRHDADSAIGWRNHLVSMDLYTEFAAYFAVSRLLEQERLRIGQPAGMADATNSGNAAR